jgi:hypothetical protein
MPVNIPQMIDKKYQLSIVID